jgi:hypothetical protein
VDEELHARKKRIHKHGREKAYNDYKTDCEGANSFNPVFH